MTQPLILGSSSPYRRELLERLRLPFSIDAPDIDETPRAGELPQHTALRLAEAKARAVAARHPDALIIGSDQVLVLGNQQLGKPKTRDNAIRQLERLQGQTAVFHSALCLFNAATGRLQIDDVETVVEFRQFGAEQLARYVDLDDPLQCAGAARAESLGIALMARMESTDPTAIIGLPLIRLTGMLLAEDVVLL